MAPIHPVLAHDAAAAWFARVRSGDMSAAERQAFNAWLRADGAHPVAYERYRAVWAAMRLIREEPAILEERERLRRRGRRRWFAVGAAAVAAAVALAWSLPLIMKQAELSKGLDAAGADRPTRFGTGVGQVSRILLPDGSTVVLDADSALLLRFSPERRDVTLERGRAFFHVAHESRPFVVAANQFSVKATGTQFVVDRSGAEESVSMIEGSVEATGSQPGVLPKPVSLKAGSQLVDDGHGRWAVTPADIEAERDWMNGRLTFHQEQVGVIVEQMNRYSQQKIVIADPALAERPLSAVLRAGDAETLVSALSDLGLARVSSRDASEIVLTSQ